MTVRPVGYTPAADRWIGASASGTLTWLSHRHGRFGARTKDRAIPWLIVALLALANPTAIAGQGDPPRHRAAPPISGYDHRAWTMRDGAPSTINFLAQSVDGVIWIGAAGGLTRFDGVRFERVLPDSGAFPALAINVLLPLPDSSLWIGYMFGGATRLHHGRAVSYGQGDGLPEGTINAMVLDSAGAIWVATTTGVARFLNGRWARLGEEAGFPGGMTPDLLVDRRGTVWLMNRAGVFVLPRGATRVTLQAPSLDPAGDGVGNAFEAPDGSVWGSSTALSLTLLSDSAGRPVPSRRFAAGLGDVWAAFLDRQSMVWVLSTDGFRRMALPAIGDQQTQPAEHIQLVDNTGAAFLEDREGNFWLGTDGGLERFRETKFTRLQVTVDWPSLVPAPTGGVWMGGIFQKVIAVGPPAIRGEIPHDITCAYRDLTGGIWFAGEEMWHAPAPAGSEPATFRRVMLPAAPGPGDVQAIARTLDGDLWVSVRGGTSKGVYRWHGAEWTLVPLPAQFGGVLAATIAADSTGTVWLGYAAGELIRITADSTTVFSKTDGLDVGAITALLIRGRRLWIGGESGLTLFDGGRFHSVAAAPALRGLSGIVETGEGDLWLNGSGGVTHLPAGELRRAVETPGHQAHGERFDHHDGLDGEAPQLRPLTSAVQTPDGRLWFTTHRSVLWIDPARIRRNPLPPPVQIRAVSAEGRGYRLEDTIGLPRRTTQLQVGYTALSLGIPDRVRFRYRLTGVDTAWVDAGTRREAFYTNLGPGEYRFQVIAANEDGVWNAEGASLMLEIPPTFTQTRAFTALVVATVLSMVWLLALWRHRQVTRALRAEFSATLAERARVARELHDTLLSDLAGVALQLNAGARTAASGGAGQPVVELLSTLRAQVQDTAAAARRTVNAIRSPTEDLPPLHEQLAAAAERVFAGTAVSVQVGHAGAPRSCPAPVCAEIVGIATEAMLNARRHADCATVTIECRYDRREIRVRVRDDGRGFDSSRPPPAGHWGLLGMRERARSIGATLDLTSREGGGTEVTLALRDGRVPLAGRIRAWFGGSSLPGLVVAIALLPALGGCATRPDLPIALPNDNRDPAGRLENGVLTLDLEAREGRWLPDGENGPGLVVQLFAEAGGPPRNPGPLVRVPAGTTIRLSVRSRLRDSVLVLYGMNTRPGGRADTVQIAPGARRELSFEAGEPGTYFYWGSTTGDSVDTRHGIDSQLQGAFIVDPAGGPVRPDRVFVLGSWTGPVDSASGFTPDLRVVNGLSWPHTERLSYAAGDTVLWRWVNPTDSPHPMHLHGFYFDVLSRGSWAADTVYPPGDPRTVVTEMPRPGQTYLMRWVPDEPGNWLMHCHIAYHTSLYLSARLVAEPADPLAVDPMHGMRGMVLAVTVEPGRSAARRPVPDSSARAIRLIAQAAPRRYRGILDEMAFVMQEGDKEPAPDSVPWPSSLLVLNRNQPVRITVVNRTRTTTGVHWHGIEVPAYSDGVPDWSGHGSHIAPAIAPGDSFTAAFTPTRSGTFIYHAHSNENYQVNLGLYGGLLVVDSGTYRPDVDRLILIGGSGGSGSPEIRINGQLRPDTLRLRVGTKYRLRLIHIIPDWTTWIALLKGDAPVQWRALAKDGAELPPVARIVRRAALLAGPGETMDFEYIPDGPGALRLEVERRTGGFRTELPIRVDR